MTREAPPLSFVELIAPLDDAAFFAEHLGRHALRLPARPLSGLDGVDASALATLGPGHVDVIVGGLATPEPAIAIPEGCSLRVRRVQVLDATVERFARGLAAALREEVSVNLYVSPRTRSSAFTTGFSTMSFSTVFSDCAAPFSGFTHTKSFRFRCVERNFENVTSPALLNMRLPPSVRPP